MVAICKSVYVGSISIAQILDTNSYIQVYLNTFVRGKPVGVLDDIISWFYPLDKGLSIYHAMGFIVTNCKTPTVKKYFKFLPSGLFKYFCMGENGWRVSLILLPSVSVSCHMPTTVRSAKPYHATVAHI